MIPTDLPDRWRELANDLAPYAPPAAEAWRRAAEELEDAMNEWANEKLTLAEAAAESGYARRTIRGKVATGEIPNVGRHGAPRVRRGDLPLRRSKLGRGDPFDASEEVHRLLAT